MAKYRNDNIMQVETKVNIVPEDITAAEGYDMIIPDIDIDYIDGYSGEIHRISEQIRSNLIKAFEDSYANGKTAKVAIAPVGERSGYPADVAAQTAVRIVCLFLQSHMETMDTISWFIGDPETRAAYEKAISEMRPKVAWWLTL